MIQLVILIGLLVLSGCTHGVPCRADAKVCPDGTTVGRTAPNCEFPECPSYDCQDDEMTCPDGYVVARVGPDCEFKCPTFS